MNEPTVTFTGNLTNDPEIRFTPTGKPVASLTVACTPRRQDPSGAWIDGATVFWNCQAWGSLAEHAADSLTKGARVLVMGRVKANVWTPTDGPNAGIEQKRLEVLVDELGPSLRFVTTKTIKTGRGGSDSLGPVEEGAPF
jgi:single-strand DNA-binding protein